MGNIGPFVGHARYAQVLGGYDRYSSVATAVAVLAKQTGLAEIRPMYARPYTEGTYPRDLIGYGTNPPQAAWPNGARIAVQIVMNYEEGSEYSISDGDDTSEIYLTEVPGATVGPGKRDLIVESVYEYGSRAVSGV